MEKQATIHLFQAAATVVEVDLTDFALQRGKVVLTMRKRRGGVVRTWEFDTSRIHRITFDGEFTAGLELGRNVYEYDLMWHVNGERFPQCAPTPIEVSRTVGGVTNG